MAINSNPATSPASNSTQSAAGGARLQQANPNTIADQLRALGLGFLVRQLRTALRRQNPNAVAAGVLSPWDVATVQAILLPDDAKAQSISRAYARAGAAGTGEMTVAAVNATPTTGQVAVSPAGNIVFLGSDAITDVDVDYEVVIGDIVELTVPVVSGTGVLTIPTAYAGTAGMGTPGTPIPAAANSAYANTQVPNAKGVLVLMEAQALTGTSPGQKIVLAPAAGAPTAGNARLNVAKTTVQFAVADAVTSARIKFLVCAGQAGGTDRNAFLEQTDQNF